MSRETGSRRAERMGVWLFGTPSRVARCSAWATRRTGSSPSVSGRDIRRSRSAGSMGAWTSFFSPNGAVFCTTGDVGTSRVFRSETGELLFALPDTVYGGAFSAKGDLVAIYGEERGVHLWDVHHRQKLHTLRGHLSSIVAVTFDPRGRLAATASREGVVKTWGALQSGQAFLGEALIYSSGYSPDGKWLATAPGFRGIRLWEADTGRLRWIVPSRTQTASTMSFSPDSRRLFVAGSDRCVRIFNVADGTPAGMLRGHRGPATVVHCSPDGRYVATGDYRGVVKIWDAASGTELRSLTAHRAFVLSLQFDPTSRFLVSTGSGRPRVWEAASGQLAAVWKNQSQGTSSWGYSPDGLRFAVPVADMSSLGISVPKLEIWDAEQGRALLSLEVHRESIYAAAFDPFGGRRIVTSSMDTTVRQWEAFPWRDADYAEPRGKPLIERLRHYARDYWRERLGRVADVPPMPRMSEEPPLPPGIPEWERGRWPRRDPQAGPLQVNLDSAYTGVLDACIYPTGNDAEYDDDLSELPSGLQQFGGVVFDVRGVVWLRSRLPNPSDPTSWGSDHDFPERVNGIAIGRKFSRLHILHAATTCFAGDTESFKGLNGEPLAVAAYVLRYADGTQHAHEVVYGRDLRDWWWGGRGDDEANVERATVAWTGSNAGTERYEAKLRLFLCTFENPRSDVEVVGIDFVSKLTPAAPFLVAMTVEP